MVYGRYIYTILYLDEVKNHIVIGRAPSCRNGGLSSPKWGWITVGNDGSKLHPIIQTTHASFTQLLEALSQ
jgi:hypothetical protein